MDQTFQVALVSLFTTIITTAGIVAVAVVNNRRERGASAESAMEKTLRERIVLRDEQITELRHDLEEKNEELSNKDLAIKDREAAIMARDRIIEKQNEELLLWREGRLS